MKRVYLGMSSLYKGRNEIYVWAFIWYLSKINKAISSHQVFPLFACFLTLPLHYSCGQTVALQNISFVALPYFRNYMCFETRKNTRIIRSPRNRPPQYLIVIIIIIIGISIITLSSLLMRILILLTPQSCFITSISASRFRSYCAAALSLLAEAVDLLLLKIVHEMKKKVKYKIWFEYKLLNIIKVVYQQVFELDTWRSKTSCRTCSKSSPKISKYSIQNLVFERRGYIWKHDFKPYPKTF